VPLLLGGGWGGGGGRGVPVCFGGWGDGIVRYMWVAGLGGVKVLCG